MTKFLLNNQFINTDKPKGMLLLDFVRYEEHLKGTKIGCREGDCGACTVLVGEWHAGRLRYRTATSCLTALGNIAGKHVVTIEGLNGEGLNPLQRAISEEGGTQCGFCTPGFVMSMAGYCLAGGKPGAGRAIAAVDGNICRCTGYKSIQRALERVSALLAERPGEEEEGDGTGIGWLVGQGILPGWFNGIGQRLLALQGMENGVGAGENGHHANGDGIGPPGGGVTGTVKGDGREGRERLFLGGGTDLYVQRHERMPYTDISFLSDRPAQRTIRQRGNICEIGGAATVTDLVESPVILQAIPAFPLYAKLISSTPIRNIATVAGNFVNASPIGDLSIFFLAMGATLELQEGEAVRTLALRDFFLGYKQLNKRPGEWIGQIRFELPGPDEYCHFEKVSKRTHLDIASVNTAIRLRMEGDRIAEGSIAAGGVGPVPACLAEASALLKGRTVDAGLVSEVVRAARGEIRPISDARGTAAYKTLLLGQLIKAHFVTIFPGLI